jgi:predicted deacylase
MTDDPAHEASPSIDAGLFWYTNRPLCASSDLVRFAVTPGNRMKANQPLARIYSAFGSCEETLRAAAPGYVLGLADHARGLPGSEVIAIAELDA